MGTKRNVDMSATTDTVKVVVNPNAAADATANALENPETAEASTITTEEGTPEVAAPEAAPKKVRQGRSPKYQSARSQVDKTKLYDAFAAVEMVKRLSYSKFDGTIEAHGVVREEGSSFDLTLPHATGKSIKVAIASDELLAELDAGKIEFDVLLTTKAFMPKLAKYAKILGPKGLMPNPKNGTLTEDPTTKAKEFASGKMTIKSEKKAPLVHLTLGKVSMDTKALVENLQELTKAGKGKLVRLVICASMSPSVKVAVE